MNRSYATFSVKGGTEPLIGYTDGMFQLLLLACKTPIVEVTPPQPVILSLSVEAVPEDANIVVNGIADDGDQVWSQLSPGEYDIAISRTGFATANSTINIDATDAENGIVTVRLELEPENMPLHFSFTPADTAWVLTTSNGETQTGSEAFSGEVPSGLTTVTATKEGMNPLEWSHFIDAPVSHNWWLDPAGQVLHRINQFQSGPHPKGLTISSGENPRIWVSLLAGPPSVESYDLLTAEQTSTLSIGVNGAVEVLLSDNEERVFASQMETAAAYEIDAETGALLRTFPSKSAWSKMMVLSPDGSLLYLSNWSGNDISEINLETGETQRKLRSTTTPRGMFITPDGQYLYIAGFGNGILERIGIQSGARETLFDNGGALRHIVADYDNGRMYISDMRKGVIWLHDIEAKTTTVLARTDANPNTIDLSPDGQLLFVSCRGVNNRESYYKPGPQWGSVLVFDAMTGEQLDAIVAGNQPTALDVSPDGRYLAYSDYLDNTINVFAIPDTQTLREAGGGRSSTYKAELRK